MTAVKQDTPEKNIVLITGASSGIGKACFDHLSEVGYMVYGTSRRADGSDGMLRMDVTVADSIQTVVNDILEKHQRIDTLINNAGISIVGAAEDTSQIAARVQMETNFWGVVQMNNAVLPVMRKQNCGKIIHVSSLAGSFALPYQSFYTASKHALEGYCESLRMEVKPFNIHISVVQPGDFRTAIFENRAVVENAFSTAYGGAFETALEIIADGERRGADPRKIAVLMHKIIGSKAPKLRYAIGKPLDLFAARAKHYLPQRLFQWLIMSHYRI